MIDCYFGGSRGSEHGMGSRILIYIYIYIQRERERGRERVEDDFIAMPHDHCFAPRCKKASCR